MPLIERLRDVIGGDEAKRREAENATLREREQVLLGYLRERLNRLRELAGSTPLAPEELDGVTLVKRDPLGLVAASFAQALDDLAATNEQLLAATEEIQAILAVAGVGILVVDDQMRIQAFNTRIRENFLQGRESAIGESCCTLLCGSEQPPPDCTLTRVLEARAPYHHPNWTYKDRHYEVAGAPIRNRSGAVTHAVLVYNDITDRLRTERSLRETELMFRTLAEHATDLIQSVAPDGSFRFVNRAWLEAMGYSEAELVGLALPDIIHPDHLGHCLELFRQLLEGNRAGRVATVFITKEGRPLAVEGTISCIVLDGRPVASCGIFRRPAAASALP
jgi:two-component system phosphate regulon sensor histidine kinase PhoR